ncbi:MAG: hypothetical protein ABIP94_18830 [Planctomycetota bacterium]
MNLAQLADFLLEWRSDHPVGSKKALVAAVAGQTDLRPDKALLVGPQWVLRISQMEERGNDSNAIVALRKIHEYDDRPIVVCLLTALGMRLVLANTSFVEKVSDRSYRLAKDHLTGSVLDTDILAAYDGVANLPANFDKLWAVHVASDAAANMERIVAATQAMHASAAALYPDRVKPRMVR